MRRFPQAHHGGGGIDRVGHRYPRPVEYWRAQDFGYKWNMGWMHDTLNYISKDPIHRKHHHGRHSCFGLHYAFSGKFHPAAVA